MNEAPVYLSLQPDALLAKVQELRDQGWRLVQIGATLLNELIELNYSFDREGNFLNLRLSMPSNAARVPSISSIYWCAFIYENEMHDLFRVRVEGIVVDYKGKFYRTTVPFPFTKGAQAASPAPAIKPSAAPAAAPATPTVQPGA
ncbi:MAG: NADH-quinone oxidoreductase subunit C [Opitutaceae bacterium]|jgi:ech hydrogenase subunit D